MSIVPELERKLNPVSYARRARKMKNISLSSNNYWDWLIFIDVGLAGSAHRTSTSPIGRS